MKKPKFSQRFSYWFDNRMAHGTGSMIKMLAIATLVFILLVAGAVTVLGLQEEGGFSGALWDSFASTVNSWVFYSGDGSIAYVAVMSLAAVAGLFVTSVLIGIIGSGIEEKLSSLRRGNSLVLETEHTVVLGYNEQVFAIISQLVTAAGTQRCCIVVAGDADKEEMEQQIRDRTEHGKNVRIICRSCDIFEPLSLRCCAIAESAAVIVNLPDSAQAVRCILAVGELTGGENKTRISCAVSDPSAVLPAEIAGEGRADVLDVGELVSRIIAHTCRQAGISGVMTELFSFEGDEFYIKSIPQLAGKSFAEASLCFESTLLLGICRKEQTLLNPAADELLLADDMLIILSRDSSGGTVLNAARSVDESAIISGGELAVPEHADNILVIGCNSSFETMLSQLASSVQPGSALVLAGAPDGTAEAGRCGNLELTIKTVDTSCAQQLEALLEGGAQHVVLLSDMQLPDAEADDRTLMTLLRLRDIKRRLGLNINITTQMRTSQAMKLARCSDVSDFIVGADIAGLVVVQISHNRRLVPVFRELLSNEGSELYLKDAALFVQTGTPVSTATLIAAAQRRGCVFLGYMSGEAGAGAQLNPPAEHMFTPKPGDRLVVLDSL